MASVTYDGTTARVDPTRPSAEGERVHLRTQPGREQLPPPSSGRRLPAA